MTSKSLSQLHGTHRFVLDNAPAAAKIEAQKQDGNQNLSALQEATTSLTSSVSGDQSRLFEGGDLEGARDQAGGTVFLSANLKGNFVEVAVHEMGHGYTSSENYAD